MRILSVNQIRTKQYNNYSKTYLTPVTAYSTAFKAKLPRLAVKEIPTPILENIQNTISRYKLFDNNEVHVAYSGGKDSLFLCHALKSLGYDVKPIMIDIGYGAKYDIALNNLKSIGIDGFLLSKNMVKSISHDSIENLNRNFNKIKSLSMDTGDTAKKTNICTPCYNSKIILLIEFAKQNGIKNVAFGHHATDSLSSMLKSYYMYIDRWVAGHREFNISNFSRLIDSQKPLYRNGIESDFTKLTSDILDLIQKQKVGTDEPVIRRIKATDTVISRPLFGVFENDIIQHFKNTDIVFPESECFFMGFRTKNSLTPRELIQYQLLGGCSPEKKEILSKLCKKTLNEDGTQIVDVRNNRSSILGPEYKNGKFNTIKL